MLQHIQLSLHPPRHPLSVASGRQSFFQAKVDQSIHLSLNNAKKKLKKVLGYPPCQYNMKLHKASTERTN